MREQFQGLIAGERFDASRAQTLVLEKTEAVRNASPAPAPVTSGD